MRKLITTGAMTMAGIAAAAAPAFAAPGASAALQADGCTGVPDSSFGADFTAACNTHDNCYDVGSQVPRLECDRILLTNLSDACNRESYAVSLCVQQANIYYNGVRALGRSHYLGSGDPS